MSKFIRVKDSTNFEKIQDYIKNRLYNNYYITPNLMHKFLNSPCVCTLGVSYDHIKKDGHHIYHMVTNPVFNKVFQTNVFRIDAIQIDYKLHRLERYIDFDSIIFGLESDEKEFKVCAEHEVLK